MKPGVRKNWILAVLLGSMSLRLLSSPLSDAERTEEIVKGREAWLHEMRTVLEHAETFTLFSLDPEGGLQKTPKVEFKSYPQLGRTQIPQGSERTNLVAVLYDGIANGSAIFNCFNPRHGIRATQGSNTVELLICFECGQVYTFSSRGTNQMFATTEEPAAVFNALLKKAKVPLPKD